MPACFVKLKNSIGITVSRISSEGFDIQAPFQALSSDINYIMTGEGFEYLCQVRDVMSSIVLSWGMSDVMRGLILSLTRLGFHVPSL
jgi:transposase InsO family protein